jgi:hypothetical protein
MPIFKPNRRLALALSAPSAITLVACNTTLTGDGAGMAKLSEAKRPAASA